MSGLPVDEALKNAIEIIQEGIRHKNFLLRSFMAYMLDTGNYEYSITLQELQDLDYYGFEYVVEDETLKIRINFPEANQNDTPGELH